LMLVHNFEHCGVAHVLTMGTILFFVLFDHWIKVNSYPACSGDFLFLGKCALCCHFLCQSMFVCMSALGVRKYIWVFM
jgi:hypothetical protein